MSNDRAFAAWEDLRRRVEALESRLPVPMADKQHWCGAMHRTGNWHCNREPQHPDAHQCWHDGGLLHEWDGDPEPAPEWRKLADAGVRNLTYTHEGPLVVVLRSLSNIANPKKDTNANLARIIAVCEGQVGDGWQADPSEWPMTPNMYTLLTYLTDSKWRRLANAASAWLRDITEDGAE